MFALITRLVTLGAMAVFLLIMFLLPLSAFAMPLCIPTPGNQLAMKASPIGSVASPKLGGCFWYSCYLDEFTPEYPHAVQTNAWCGDVTEIAKMGSRMATILNATDPLKSAQTAGNRFPIYDLREQRFEQLRTLMCTAGGPCIPTLLATPPAPAP